MWLVVEWQFGDPAGPIHGAGPDHDPRGDHHAESGPLSKEPTIAKATGPAPTKLVVKDIVTGTGTPLKVGQTATVNYVGVTTANGKLFDASWTHGMPAQFQLTPGALIAGWVQGLPGMRIGGRRELIIPAALAYGKAGRPTAGIGPNAALTFVIDLLGVS